MLKTEEPTKNLSVVGHCALGVVLRRGSEHLWTTCPMFVEDDLSTNYAAK